MISHWGAQRNLTRVHVAYWPAQILVQVSAVIVVAALRPKHEGFRVNVGRLMR